VTEAHEQAARDQRPWILAVGVNDLSDVSGDRCEAALDELLERHPELRRLGRPAANHLTVEGQQM
jgi:hypothetical protein